MLIHQSNPVYSLNGIDKHLQRTSGIVYIGTMHNETADLADWILPAHYPLEEWGDYETWEGTISLMQPTMAPLYETKSSGDILLSLHNIIP